MDTQSLKRRAVRAVIGPMLRWPKLRRPEPGFSIVLGTPWMLRHLLEVNLRFVEKSDLSGLDRLLVVFDRVRQPEGEAFIASVKTKFPKMPLEFHFHPAGPGRIVQKVNQSKFYASLNWVTGLKHCRTKYAVLHDFDLYPVAPNLFVDIVGAMERKGVRFSGAEHTRFDGLTESDALIGTWELGIDVEWLRENYRPIDCFHSVTFVNGRRVDVDAFSEIQSNTPNRGLAGTVGRESYAHVTNLCSTYLRFVSGDKCSVAWRLNYLWYLESLCEGGRKLGEVSEAMARAGSANLTVGDYETDFSTTHRTCANVLRKELRLMEKALFRACRAEVEAYVAAFDSFLAQYGDNSAIVDSAGRVTWTAEEGDRHAA